MEFIDDYVAFELFEEALCVPTEIDCPNCCECLLLFDQARAIYLCPDCRSEFIDEGD
jgi:hypothetical protein